MKKKNIFLLSIGVLLLGTAAAGRGQYDKLFVVPKPGPVGIDGKLDDWDLSASLPICVVPETAETQSATFALMYDDEALYLGGKVRDTSPMMNRHEPEASGNKAWDADACQFRIVVDPKSEYPVKQNQFMYKGRGAERQAKDKRDDIVHLTLWNYTDRQEANLQMYLGMTYRFPRPEWAPHGVVPKNLFEGKYLKDDDNLGFTFEYKIPWTTLGLKKGLTAGDIVAGTVQFNWSRPDGLKTAGGSAWAYDVMNRGGFPFQDASCWGKLVFLKEGNVPRKLVDAGLPPNKPLPLSFEYELPEDSEVTVQLVDKQNMIVKTLVAQGKRNAGKNVEKWDGLDDQENPLPSGEYQWRGIYHEPIQAKWRFSVHNSGNPPYPTPNNKGGWGADHGVPTTTTAVLKGMLLAWNYAEYGWGIIRVNENGRKMWGSKHCASQIASDGKRYFTADQGGFHGAPGVKVFDLKDSRPLAWENGKAYLIPPDGAGGNDKNANEMTGLAYADGKIYVAYKNRNLIGLFDAQSGNLLTTWNVSAPTFLTCRKDGTLLIVSQEKILAVKDGKPTIFTATNLDDPQGIAVASEGQICVANRGKLMNISVFDQSGKFLKSIGREGGRNAIGEYQPDGVYMPGGIAFDAKNRLWVAEQSDSPKRFSVWDIQTGELVYEFFGASSYFGYCFIDPAKPDEIYGHNVLWKIDWKNYTTKPISTIWRKTTPDAMSEIFPDGYQGHIRVFSREDGKQFAYGNGKGASILAVRKGNIFQPYVAFMRIGENDRRLFNNPDPAKIKPDKYFWQDANDDGKVQADELHVVTLPPHNMGIRAVDPNTMTLWLGPNSLTPYELKNGLPMYQAKDIRPNILSSKKCKPGNYTWLDPDGSVFSLTHGQKPSWAKWAPEGKMLVGYPDLLNWRNSLSKPVVKAGRLWGMTGPLGIAGDFTGNMTYFGVNHIFMRDGTYLAAIGYDGRIGGHPSLQGQPEGQMGALVKLRIDDADRYFLLHGGQDGRVIEIMGLDTVKRLPGGTLTISQEDAAKAAKALTEYNAKIAASGGLNISRGKSSLDVAKTVGKSLEGARGFKAAMAYDADNLHVKYIVKSDSPLVNLQADPTLIFKGGNLIDIQIGTNPQANPKRSKPGIGDVRLLVSLDDKGKTRAVFYRPKVEGFKGSPIVLKSPTGEESFDAVTDVSEQVKVEYRPLNDGFEAMVTIQLKLLGFVPKQGQKVQCDLGYIFGNNKGTRTLIRAYWVNNSFTANVVDDIPHESRLEPEHWGNATVE